MTGQNVTGQLLVIGNVKATDYSSIAFDLLKKQIKFRIVRLAWADFSPRASTQAVLSEFFDPDTLEEFFGFEIIDIRSDPDQTAAIANKLGWQRLAEVNGVDIDCVVGVIWKQHHAIDEGSMRDLFPASANVLLKSV
jgi:hypothetical protein